MTSTPRTRRGSIFGAPEEITDNVALLDYLNTVRRLVHAGAVELGVTAAEVEARLRGVSPGVTVGGLTARHRARQVARPLELAGESLTLAARYAVTAANRFMAAYLPELEAAGNHQSRRPDFRFRAG